MTNLGVWLPSPAPTTDKPEYARLAEELGYTSAWASGDRHGDQFCVLTACALATRRITLGTNVATVFNRLPQMLGGAAATVDHFSNGRMVLGLGTDHDFQVGPMLGMSYEKPFSRMREAVEIIRRLLRDDEVSYQGKIFNISLYDFTWGFRSLRPRIPVWIAGGFPAMLRVAGEVGDGIIMNRRPLYTIPECLKYVQEGAARAGKSARDMAVATMLTCRVAETREDARRRFRLDLTKPGAGLSIYATYTRHTAAFRPTAPESRFREESAAVSKALAEGDRERAMSLISDDYIDNTAVVGTPKECREKIEEYRAAGITEPVVNLFAYRFDKSEFVWGLRALAPSNA